MIRSTLGLAAAGLLMGSLDAEAASNIEDALNEIANTIVAGLPSDNTPTIAISTFTHSGNSCSALSTYASEMMLPTLLTAGHGNVNIIARSQLSALFREHNLIYDGTISPNAAQQIGQVSGVQAILAATILPFGEQVMIISTLISTSDGAVLGSANAQFPVTETVRSQLEIQSVTLCGFSPSATVAGAKAEAAVASVAPDGGSRPAPSGNTLFQSDLFSAEIVALTYARSTGEARWSIRFSDTGEKPIGLSFVSGTEAAADDQGGTIAFGAEWSGLRRCGGVSYMDQCTPSRPDLANTLEPGGYAQLNFNTLGAKNLEDPLLTLTFDVVVTPDANDPASYQSRSVGFYDVKPVTK